MGLYLALDVGGTKTAAALADDTRVLARAAAGSIKTLRVAPAEAEAHLKTLLTSLAAQAGTPVRGAVTRTCVGTSGIAAPSVRAWMHSAFAAAVGGEFLLLGDEVIALDAAFRGARGVLVIAGTGSNIVGRARSGAMVHTGGWGPALADEGSGHWIGTEALRACFRAIDAALPSSADAVAVDGRPRVVLLEHLPPLLARAIAALGFSSLDEMIGAANTPGFHSAALVPVVVAAAEAGDALALAVLTRAGNDAARLVEAVIRKVRHFESAEPDASAAEFQPPEVAFVGGVLANIEPVRSAMHRTLAGLFPGIVLQAAATDPLEGALWHARGRPGPALR